MYHQQLPVVILRLSQLAESYHYARKHAAGSCYSVFPSGLVPIKHSSNGPSTTPVLYSWRVARRYSEGPVLSYVFNQIPAI